MIISIDPSTITLYTLYMLPRICFCFFYGLSQTSYFDFCCNYMKCISKHMIPNSGHTKNTHTHTYEHTFGMSNSNAFKFLDIERYKMHRYCFIVFHRTSFVCMFFSSRDGHMDICWRYVTIHLHFTLCFNTRL